MSEFEGRDVKYQPQSYFLERVVLKCSQCYQIIELNDSQWHHPNSNIHQCENWIQLSNCQFRASPNIDDHSFKNNNQQQMIQKNLVKVSVEPDILQNAVSGIFQLGRLSKGSQVSYKSAMESCFRYLMSNSKELSSSTMIEYLQVCKPSITTINAVTRICKQEGLKLKMLKANAKEKTTRRQHQTWNFKLLQKFLDDLIICEKGLLTFRLFILLNLALRISELEQITFAMVCTGHIRYVPKKQIKKGKDAERCFQIAQKVIDQTQSFMIRNKIGPQRNLLLGMENSKLQLIHYKKSQSEPTDKDYLNLLESFSFHDLRHTKLFLMNEQGRSLENIQSYVAHQHSKTTSKYLKFQKKEMADLGVVMERCDDNFQLKDLKLNFIVGCNNIAAIKVEKISNE